MAWGVWLVACWKAWSSLKKPLRVLWEGGGRGRVVGSERRVGLGSRVQMGKGTADGTHTRPATHALGCRVGAAKAVCVVKWCPKMPPSGVHMGGLCGRARFVSAADGLAFCSKLKAGRQAAAPPTSDRINTDSRRPTLLSAPPSLDKATAKHEEGKNKAGQ